MRVQIKTDRFMVGSIINYDSAMYDIIHGKVTKEVSESDSSLENSGVVANEFIVKEKTKNGFKFDCSIQKDVFLDANTNSHMETDWCEVEVIFAK